jgi:hypothetical protein
LRKQVLEEEGGKDRQELLLGEQKRVMMMSFWTSDASLGGAFVAAGGREHWNHSLL